MRDGYWTLYPAVAMSLGWGLRGYIGGGPLGAMIPGAMVALVLCLLLERGEADAGVIAAFGAVGVGFGGQMTYGQTIGHSLQPETMWFGLLGLGIKGAIWGLLGGAVLGLAFVRGRYGHSAIVVALALMIFGHWVGWKLINEPKLIYFSNRLDKPRPEIWAGLLIGAILMLAWLGWKNATRIPHRFALWACLGGGIGFCVGGAFQVAGRRFLSGFPDWWKVMEFTFGFCFGWVLGYCAWKNRAELRQSEPVPQDSRLLWIVMFVASWAALAHVVPGRFGYTIIGSVLVALAMLSASVGWQIAVSMTYCAFAIDFVRNKPMLNQTFLAGIVFISTAAVIVWVARRPGIRALFVFLTVAAVVVSYCKAFLPPGKSPYAVEAAFTSLMLAVIWMTRGTLKQSASAVPSRSLPG